MVYIYKEYNHIFDTPTKREQEGVIVNKIMDLINNNKYSSIEDFINNNQTYNNFLENNDFEIVIKHFRNTLNDQEYKSILDSMVNLTEKKRSFSHENLKTTNIDEHQYVSYQGLDNKHFFDNSHSGMSIESEMEELKKTQSQFQTSSPEQNTENMMKELAKSTKEVLNLKYLNEIDFNSLNNEQKLIFNAVANYQLNLPNPVRVDIEKGVVVDETNNIMKIEKNNNDEITMLEDNNVKKSTDQAEELKESKTFQKTLIPRQNPIYSDNN